MGEVMTNLPKLPLPKRVFDMVKKMTNTDLSVKEKTKQNNTQIAGKVRRIRVKADSNNPINYSKELHDILGVLSQTAKKTNLTQTEVITLKSFMSAIRGLNNSGNSLSAYIVAKNAITYLSGASYPYGRSNFAKNLPTITDEGAVKVSLSDKAKLHSQQEKHIKLESTILDFSKKGEFLNRKI